MIKSMIVVGGGNAGLMAALYLRASFSDLTISVIKSDKIGTIGVGEGSTEHWSMFASATGISIGEIVAEAGATLKSGIKFENWHGDGTSYFHCLPEFLSQMDRFTGMPYSLLHVVGNDLKDDNLHWGDLNKVSNPYQFSQFHFDSIKLNNLFLKHCSLKAIKVIDAEIIDVKLNEEGFVESVIDINNQHFSADFFIDSSGFNRVVSSKLGTTWVSYSEYLPMNSAIAFPSEYIEDIPTYSLSRALKNGWMWRSPVQERFGNGYVFSDLFTNGDNAIEEIQLQPEFKNPIKIAKVVKFNSGRVDNFWIKNCVNVGLSSNFVEPLEASNISTTVQQLRGLVAGLSTWEPGDNTTIKMYNKTFDDVMTNVLDFIQLHYFTEREDTEFWKFCKYELKKTPFLEENLEFFKKNFINQIVLSSENFNIYDCLDWIQVMHGLRMFDIPRIKNMISGKYNLLANISKQQIHEARYLNIPNLIPARQAIENVKQDYLRGL